MAIAFRAAGTAVTADAATTITPTAPAGTAATDVVLCALVFSGGTNITITPPTGWTLVGRANSTTIVGIALYRALGSATFGAYTMTSGGAVRAVTLGYTGVDNTTPMDATATTQANASSATITHPSITTVTANAWLVGMGGLLNASTFSALFGTLAGSGSFAGQNQSVAEIIQHLAQAVAGASGTKTTTASIAAVNVAIMAALRPAGTAAASPRAIRRSLQAVGRASVY